MTVLRQSAPRTVQPRRLHLGVSLAAMASGLAMPAEAQLAALRGAAGTTPVAPVTTAPVVPVRPATMVEALARSQAMQTRADQIRGYVTAARDAALAATRGKPTDGLSADGLDPIKAVREAAALTAKGGADNLARAQALLQGVSAANDATGTNTWEGAGAPVQTVDGGKTQVSITQNQERALLTWNRFDVGANTTLQFVQKKDGVAQTGWTVVNRVAQGTAPSTILGSVKADGTVLVLNRNGVIFGQGAQVNLGSLLASTLEIGNYGRNFREINIDGRTTNVFDAITLKERNTEYLQNGLFAGTQTNGALPSLLLSSLYPEGTNVTASEPAIEGSVEVDAGASITAANGGFLILAGPKVVNAGTLKASDGQVSLQGGRLVAATRSTGAANSADTDVRGLILRTIGTVEQGTQRRSSAAVALRSTPDDGEVINSGLIESPRGYLSLGAGLFGSVTNDGLLTSTTSVSRNGKISLTAGTVTLGGDADRAKASGIVLLPDASTETIPQGTADAPAAFKTSSIEIGARADNPEAVASSLGIFIPSVVSMEQNSIILAPSANVVIGRDGSTAFDASDPVNTRSGITVANGAVIDVSGVKDVPLSASRNSIEVTPVKRNELRDTPNYREVSLTGDFTLNGETLFIDPRRSGVRADGVRWVGSPLIEGGSIASQIGVTAAELMTTGGNVSLGVNLLRNDAAPETAGRISIASGATIDFSGGWVHYDAGVVRSSNLITADGRIVNIGDADPNDIFVGVADGTTETQPRSGQSQSYSDPLLAGSRYEAAYDEGRDAGSLVIGGSAIAVGGTLHGDAFAGVRQIANAARPTGAATIAQDPRTLQRTAQDLPSGGLLRIGSLTGASGVALGGDIAVYDGTGRTGPLGTTLLSDEMLTGAGLSALLLQTSGAVSFAKGSSLALADGGTLVVDAGRSIRFDGTVRIASGAIRARTYELAQAPINAGSVSALGSAFRDDDDISGLYRVGSELPHPFDITVTGTLSTAGRFVNAYASSFGATQSRAFIDGGSISLTVAPKVLVALGRNVGSAQDAGDLSGRLTIAEGALLDVSAGAYVAPDRTLSLTARGGSIALINETTYASTVLTVPPVAEGSGRSDSPVAGSNQSVDFTPTDTITPALVPGDPQANVSFSEESLKGFGFASGGTFTLVAPDISFGSDTRDGSTHLSLDFFRNTGFGTLDVTAFRSRIVEDIFTNARQGNSAFFETTGFRIGKGETLDLTQSLLPRFLTAAQAGALLRETGSDTSLLSLNYLKPSVPTAAFDRVAANLTLRGLAELDVMAGGSIVGAAGATITAAKIYNAGSIVLPGGSLIQREFLPLPLVSRGLGVDDLADVFGRRNRDGQFNENAENSAGITDPFDDGRLLTVRELFTRPEAERFVYFTGLLGSDEGIRLDAGSVTDLSGVALVDTRAAFLPSGRQLVTGRVVAGGTISTASALTPPTGDRASSLFTIPSYFNARYFNASDNSLPSIVGVTGARSLEAVAGARIDLSGASALFDQQVSLLSYAPVLQWSNAGTLSLGGGAGSLRGAIIDAHGGAPRATGGTLNWVRPTIAQDYGGTRASGLVSASQIEAAGFATVNALGGVTFDGRVSLTLDKAFTVGSAPAATGVAIASDAATVISTGGRTTSASVTAPFIRFSSRLGDIPDYGEEVRGGGSVRFTGSAGIDFVGGVLFDSSVASVAFRTPGDVRFIGVDDRAANSTDLSSLNGRLVSWGDMTFDAGRVYATTGTGNLQRFIEDRRAGDETTASPFLVAAIGDAAIRFDGTYRNAKATTPLSAGSYLQIQASEITQGGYLAAPLGLLEIGSNTSVDLADFGPTIQATRRLTFLAGSVTTVAGTGLNIPYGTTTDLTEYFFSPSVGLPITATPVGQLTLAGGTIDMRRNARLDGRGGGDIFAFEFVSGTGGSRDVLDRFNRDAFSSNDYDPVTGIGYQFADRRQVYAIVPADQARAVAPFDPIYSADYQSAEGGDLYGANVGRSITLDGGNGIPAGEYVLLPAHYALLPGAYRVVENVGNAAPPPGAAQTLLDGSVIVGGVLSTAGTDLADSTRRSFTVQSKDVFLKYSRIETTGGAKAVVDQATKAGEAPPRLPIDGARVVLAPREELKVAGAFDTTPAQGGKGAQFDILARDVLIAGSSDVDVPRRTLLLTDDTLARLNANSLSIGAERSENQDGTTTLGVVSRTITVTGDVAFSAPELILSVGGTNSALTVRNGARLTATGRLDDTAAGDYVLQSLAADDIPLDYAYDASGVGAVVRLSSGSERLVDRQGETALRNTLKPATLQLGGATLSGHSVAVDSSQRLTLSDRANIVATNLALSGDTLQFGDPGFSQPLLDRLAGAARVTLRSRDAIGFSRGRYTFNDLRIDAPALALSGRTGDVTLVADTMTLGNSAADLGICGKGSFACGGSLSDLTISAREARFLSGTVRTYGFGGKVGISAVRGAYVEGDGGLDVGAAALTLTTPFLADRAEAADPAEQAVRPDYLFATSGAVTLVAPAASGTAAPAPTGNAAPGSRIAFGSADARIASLTIDGTYVRASAGVIDAQSRGSISLVNGASLATPGYSRTFGDAVDSVTVSAGGGTVNLVSFRGDIRVGAGSTLTVDTGVGKAGTLNLLASNGAITFGSFGTAIDPGITTARQASFAFDSGKSAFDLAGFAARYGTAFGGTVAIRSGRGDLSLGVAQVLRSEQVELVADGGRVLIAGTIDTSGVSVAGLTAVQAQTARVNGGDVTLFGETGVTLTQTALIDTHTSGYADTDTRSAQAGDVTLGIGSEVGAITIARGARIDAGARRTEAAIAAGGTGDRLVAQTVKDPTTLADVTAYRYAAADAGGLVTMRAPVLDGDVVDIRIGGAITGASEIQVEGFRRYDLDAIASSGDFLGVTQTRRGVSLDFGVVGGRRGPRNILTEDFVAGGQQSLVHFIRTFDISAADGTTSFDGIRLRPGVELVSDGDIALATNWNLGAGVVDEKAAIAAGILKVIPELSGGGVKRYAVVAGREAELLQNHTNMLYRVGGRIGGEAAVVSLRARGTLDISHSITDGFFSFRDRSDADYMSYQLGGGDRTVNPAAVVTCGTRATAFDCGGITSFDRAVGGSRDPSRDATVTISLTAPGAGSDRAAGTLAPFSAGANSAAALGNDPLGSADLFPLLDDGTRAVRSTSLRLVAGSDAKLSSNPLHVDRATGADVLVRGETSYKIVAQTGSTRFAGDLEVRLRASDFTGEVDPIIAAPEDFIDVAGQRGSNEQFSARRGRNYYTVLNWGSDGELASTTSDRARAYFAENFPRAVFKDDDTGVAAPLEAILGFLQSFGDEYAAGVRNGTFGVPNARPDRPASLGKGNTAYVGTVVRTGDGKIDIAAARNVDLRRTEETVYRNALNTGGQVPFDYPVPQTLYQVGGTAVYTAGHLLTRTPIVATAADGTTIRYSYNPDAATPTLDERRYQPSNRGQFFNTPQLVTGGGDISVTATSGDVLARRDVWAEQNVGTASVLVRQTLGSPPFDAFFSSYLPENLGDLIDASDQVWRVGEIGGNTQIGLVPQLFTAGVGALGGGDVSVIAGGSITDLTVALDTSITTANPLVPAAQARGNLLVGSAIAGTARPTMMTFGLGNLLMRAGDDLVGGQIDVASGTGKITIAANVVAAGGTYKPLRGGIPQGPANELRLRVADAYVTLDAAGTITLGGIGALGVLQRDSSTLQDPGLGFLSASAGVSVTSNGALTLNASRPELNVRYFSNIREDSFGVVLPPSLGLASLTGNITFGTDFPRLLYPSENGQLALLAGGSIENLALAMSDADPTLLPGAFSVRYAANSGGAGLEFGFNGVFPTTSDIQLRLYHNENITHRNDPEPARVYAGGSITGVTLSLAKQGRIGAGLDIVDMVFTGQNVRDTDVTRITAGRDIIGTTAFSASIRRPYINGNTFVLGGYGTLAIEAGRNLGPFLNSATVGVDTNTQDFAGGIRTVGNDFNPWLENRGASIQAFFGIGKGANYDGLQSVYLDPLNAAQLDGDLFAQVADENGNLRPDRTRPIYAPILARWLRANAPETFASVFGTIDDVALDAAAYSRYGAIYAAFSGLNNLTRRSFLVEQLYFNELAQTSIPTSPSFQQYIRGYRATQTLFPASLGYTDNLSSYQTDPATISADNPLGVPTRILENGEPKVATRVITGNVDLRLATIETVRGGDITILGPGGDVLAGSVVRTSDQAARRATLLGVDALNALENGILSRTAQNPIGAIPIGFEGVLSLRGGSVRSSTDGDFRLNQSRLFTLAGGDITLWSSNGNLNAGQGPRSASSFPPVTVRFDQNGRAEVDSAGSVAGAGIGAFKQSPDDPESSIILIAPVGEVDAGDAGVRASGNVFVAAARVANADNFSAGGDISGVPSSAAVANAAPPADAASSIVGNIQNLANNAANNADRLSLISVDVLGFFGNDRCDDPNASAQECPPRR